MPGGHFFGGKTMRNILFVCRDNGARSLMAETLMNEIGKGLFAAQSAGIAPRADVDPTVVILLKMLGFDTVASAKTNGLDKVSSNSAANFKLIAVLDEGVGEASLPAFSGVPTILHWPIADAGEDRIGLMETYEAVNELVNALIKVRVEDHDAESVKAALVAAQGLA
jgi:arsenate reductase